MKKKLTRAAIADGWNKIKMKKLSKEMALHAIPDSTVKRWLCISPCYDDYAITSRSNIDNSATNNKSALC